MTQIENKINEVSELLTELLACENRIALPIEKEQKFYIAIKEVRRDLEKNDAAMYANFAVNVLHRIARVPFRDADYPAWVSDFEAKTKALLA